MDYGSERLGEPALGKRIQTYHPFYLGGIGDMGDG